MKMQAPPQLLRIGELARKSQVSVKTIRYYEERGLLQAATRSRGGFRLFSPDVLPRLDFIKRSQRLGLSLQEIGDLLEIHDRGELPCAEVKQTLKIKIEAIERRIEELQTLKSQLQRIVAEPETRAQRASAIVCPLVQPERA